MFPCRGAGRRTARRGLSGRRLVEQQVPPPGLAAGLAPVRRPEQADLAGVADGHGSLPLLSEATRGLRYGNYPVARRAHPPHPAPAHPRESRTAPADRLGPRPQTPVVCVPSSDSVGDGVETPRRRTLSPSRRRTVTQCINGGEEWRDLTAPGPDGGKEPSRGGGVGKRQVIPCRHPIPSPTGEEGEIPS